MGSIQLIRVAVPHLRAQDRRAHHSDLFVRRAERVSWLFNGERTNLSLLALVVIVQGYSDAVVLPVSKSAGGPKYLLGEPIGSFGAGVG